VEEKPYQVNMIVLPTGAGLVLRIRRGTTRNRGTANCMRSRALARKSSGHAEVGRGKKPQNSGKSLLFNGPFSKARKLGQPRPYEGNEESCAGFTAQILQFANG
jgi:hypothetical protein